MFLWEIDEVAPIIAVFALGLATDTLTALLIPAFLAAKLFSTYKRNHLPGILLHLAYFYGLVPINKAFGLGTVRKYEQ
jgi:conjugal transfer pilus assembly protein TraL